MKYCTNGSQILLTGRALCIMSSECSEASLFQKEAMDGYTRLLLILIQMGKE